MSEPSKEELMARIAELEKQLVQGRAAAWSSKWVKKEASASMASVASP